MQTYVPRSILESIWSSRWIRSMSFSPLSHATSSTRAVLPAPDGPSTRSGCEPQRAEAKRRIFSVAVGVRMNVTDEPDGGSAVQRIGTPSTKRVWPSTPRLPPHCASEYPTFHAASRSIPRSTSVATTASKRQS